ncbi:unnamed protein product [Cylicocyclus nassatus]|uniref:SCP domain-containing protein n=1 Tax=Cylicocyclus nassatus TaxID=53992 RepID=A0AA36H040_CYLNA|nr:unnamed protein product [Cylicocyclus nassatus]
MFDLRCLEVLIIYVLPELIAWEYGPAYCKTANGADEHWVDRYLTTFNHQREALAHGLQEDTYGALPPAKNMNKLMWDCALEQEAKDFLAKQDCDLLTGRKEGLEEPDKGYAYFITAPIPLFHLTDDYYFSDVSDVSDQIVRYMDGDEPLKQWANIMRANASKVGCANITCRLNDDNINGRIAQYNRWKTASNEVHDDPLGKGNIQKGDTIYEGGTRKAECDPLILAEEIPESTSTTDSGASTLDPSVAVFPWSNASDPSTWCEYEELPDSLRSIMVETHNTRRSTLALGQITDNTGTTLPAATNMNYLVWACKLEKEAHDFLRNCPTEGYQRPDDKRPAQNFYRQTITANERTYKDMNKKAVTEWWKQVRKVSGPGTSTYFRLEHNSTQIRSYTLMAWASTEIMGCSIAKCGNEWVEACRYHPPGNKVDDQMYIRGKACSQCTTIERCKSFHIISSLLASEVSGEGAKFPEGSSSADIICPNSYHMTDKLGLRILDMHNSRSLLALGKVTKNTGAYLPAAANMRKLRYDCGLNCNNYIYTDGMGSNAVLGLLSSYIVRHFTLLFAVTLLREMLLAKQFMLQEISALHAHLIPSVTPHYTSAPRKEWQQDCF